MVWFGLVVRGEQSNETKYNKTKQNKAIEHKTNTRQLEHASLVASKAFDFRFCSFVRSFDAII